MAVFHVDGLPHGVVGHTSAGAVFLASEYFFRVAAGPVDQGFDLAAEDDDPGVAFGLLLLLLLAPFAAVVMLAFVVEEVGGLGFRVVGCGGSGFALDMG